MNFIGRFYQLEKKNKQKVINFVLTLSRSWRAKNPQTLSPKYLKYRICKLKQYLNYILMIINLYIPTILRTFLNLEKNLWRTLHEQKQSPEVFYIKKLFLKISLILQKNTCPRLWHRCFLVKFAKLLRAPF